MTTIEIKLIKEQVSKLTIPNKDLLTYRNRLKPFIRNPNGCIDSEIVEVYNIIVTKLALPNLVKEMPWLTGVQ